MVINCVMKMITTCSPMIGQFFDTMIVASVESGYNDTSKSNRWRQFFSHLISVVYIIYYYARVLFRIGKICLTFYTPGVGGHVTLMRSLK